jgi:hypothetical protein
MRRIAVVHASVVDRGDERTAVVDPAGMQFIRNTGGAGGASRAIYDWLGVYGRPLPRSVRDAIRAEGEAKMFTYARDRHVIHVASPTIGDTASYGAALRRLTRAYASVLREFRASGLRSLAVLPLAGDIFSGAWKPKLPALTAAALYSALDAVPTDPASITMCVFARGELAEFTAAFAR